MRVKLFTSHLTIGVVKVVYTKAIEREGLRYFVTGFPGVGTTGYIVVDYLVEKTRAERIAIIKPKHPPPFVAMAKQGLLTPFELFVSSPFLFLRAEFYPSREDERPLCETLVDLFEELGLEQAVLFGGLDSAYYQGGARVRLVATRAFLARYQRLPAPLLEPGLFVCGTLAVLLYEFEVRNLPAVSILPYAALTRPDPRAAAVAIKKMNDLLGTSFDVSELIERAEEIEAEVEQRRKVFDTAREHFYV